ncbi:hypothetical protein AVEN_204768-1 [Araneus ventricosus]|uniref:Uncharacterized protein n=1 Tax=Araneus ventricosus TaxID=182803 RepID=A0A4Y2FVY1_ARAVE|nr:hypothetical protein AVEN_204768-1 [Araneus ventricosus]
MIVVVSDFVEFEKSYFGIMSVCIVTNMESRFPAMLVLWLGREFDRGKYGMTGSIQAWTIDLGEKIATILVTNLVTKYGISKGTGIFSISLLGEEILLNVLDNSMRRQGQLEETI